jgi:hypothetical protein
LSHCTSPVLCWIFFFKMGSHRTICLDWLWTTILLISASWGAGMTGVSPRRPANFPVLTRTSVTLDLTQEDPALSPPPLCLQTQQHTSVQGSGLPPAN